MKRLEASRQSHGGGTLEDDVPDFNSMIFLGPVLFFFFLGGGLNKLLAKVSQRKTSRILVDFLELMGRWSLLECILREANLAARASGRATTPA